MLMVVDIVTQLGEIADVTYQLHKKNLDLKRRVKSCIQNYRYSCSLDVLAIIANTGTGRVNLEQMFIDEQTQSKLLGAALKLRFKTDDTGTKLLYRFLNNILRPLDVL